jgi:hypothetical protein
MKVFRTKFRAPNSRVFLVHNAGAKVGSWPFSDPRDVGIESETRRITDIPVEQSSTNAILFFVMGWACPGHLRLCLLRRF